MKTALLGAVLALSASAHAADTALPVPQHLYAGPATPQQDAVVLAARRYAAFWNTGDPSFAQLALAPDFMDRTLPEGRPQGVEGPLLASRTFRAAVPDLTVEVTDMVTAGDRVSLRLHFSGHFTGSFGGVQGQGQAIAFQAFDLYRVAGGRIAENWHLEDNLTLLQQLGVVKQ
ncbi:ester cyclase [Oxalobacteraceae bacterium A2-2]